MGFGVMGAGPGVSVGGGAADAAVLDVVGGGASAAETAAVLVGAIFLPLSVRFATRLAVRLGGAEEGADSTRMFCLGITLRGFGVMI